MFCGGLRQDETPSTSHAAALHGGVGEGALAIVVVGFGGSGPCAAQEPTGFEATGVGRTWGTLASPMVLPWLGTSVLAGSSLHRRVCSTTTSNGRRHFYLERKVSVSLPAPLINESPAERGQLPRWLLASQSHRRR